MDRHAINVSAKSLTVLGCGLLLAGLLLSAATGIYAFMALPAGLLLCLVLLRNWTTAWWILLCFIPLSAEVSVSSTLSTSLPDEPLMWVFLMVFIAGFASRPVIVQRWWWRHPLTRIVAFQLLWLVVAVCFSKEGLLSVKFLAAKCWFLVSFFVLPPIIFRTKGDFKKAFLLVLVPLLITMVIITARQAVRDFAFVAMPESIGSLYINHVEYASVVSMFLPLVWVCQRLIDARQKLLRHLVAGLVVFFMVVVIFTYARAAVLGLAFAGLVVLAIRRRLAQYIMPAVYLVIAGTLLYLIPKNRFMVLQPDYKTTYMHTTFSEHMVATIKGRDLSSMERLYRWIAAMRMSRDEPVTGFGPHAFYTHYKPYGLDAFRTYTSNNPEHSTTHNYFLLMLTEQGWPAMLLYALLMLVAFKQAQHIYHRFRDRYYKNITIGLAALLAVNFVNNFFSELIETHKVGALFYLALSLLVVLDRKSRVEAAEQGG